MLQGTLCSDDKNRQPASGKLSKQPKLKKALEKNYGFEYNPQEKKIWSSGRKARGF